MPVVEKVKQLHAAPRVPPAPASAPSARYICRNTPANIISSVEATYSADAAPDGAGIYFALTRYKNVAPTALKPVRVFRVVRGQTV